MVFKCWVAFPSSSCRTYKYIYQLDRIRSFYRLPNEILFFSSVKTARWVIPWLELWVILVQQLTTYTLSLLALVPFLSTLSSSQGTSSLVLSLSHPDIWLCIAPSSSYDYLNACLLGSSCSRVKIKILVHSCYTLFGTNLKLLYKKFLIWLKFVSIPLNFIFTLISIRMMFSLSSPFTDQYISWNVLTALVMLQYLFYLVSCICFLPLWFFKCLPKNN